MKTIILMLLCAAMSAEDPYPMDYLPSGMRGMLVVLEDESGPVRPWEFVELQANRLLTGDGYPNAMALIIAVPETADKSAAIIMIFERQMGPEHMPWNSIVLNDCGISGVLLMQLFMDDGETGRYLVRIDP